MKATTVTAGKGCSQPARTAPGPRQDRSMRGGRHEQLTALEGALRWQLIDEQLAAAVPAPSVKLG